MYICPHLDSQSPELFGGRELTAECPDYSPSEIAQYSVRIPCYAFEYQQFRTLRRGECVTWSACPNPDCLTRYCLKRVWTICHSIVLMVSRDLFNPAHSGWQAQIDRQ